MLAGVWLWLFGEHPAMTKGETLACYNPASPACYKPPSVTALSSAAATTKERAGNPFTRNSPCGRSPLLVYFASARGVGGGV